MQKTPASRSKHYSGVVGTGFAVLDRIYDVDRKSPIEALGGSCGNVLISLAMLGHSVAPMLSLGADPVGDLLLSELRAAGAKVDHIHQDASRQSPLVAEHIDRSEGKHWFSFSCPETGHPYPSYEPVSEAEVSAAASVLNECRVFYLDRLSASTVGALEIAVSSGAVGYFEPSRIEDGALMDRALRSATILKYSEEALGDDLVAFRIPETTIVICTQGAAGLTIRRGHEELRLPALSPPKVIDSSGAGDMVTVGVIDLLLRVAAKSHLEVREILAGVIGGQRLAALNCGFVGARGMFREMGPARALAALREEWISSLPDLLRRFSQDPED
jgi:fructokinase